MILNEVSGNVLLCLPIKRKPPTLWTAPSSSRLRLRSPLLSEGHPDAGIMALLCAQCQGRWERTRFCAHVLRPCGCRPGRNSPSVPAASRVSATHAPRAELPTSGTSSLTPQVHPRPGCVQRPQPAVKASSPTNRHK